MKSKSKTSKIAAVGTRITPELTVLGVIDGGSPDPVYIVWHHRAWCPMACKVFRRYADAMQEADVLASLAHPYIVRLLELARPSHLLMPFLEGPSLATVIDRSNTGRLPISNALRVAIHVGSALQHVHERGFLHLDIKPDNVIIAAGGRPILFDFGSVRKVSASRPRKVVGTDAYIAPEECRLGKVGTSADVFSLGVVIYEMLTGELPFGRGTKRQPFPQLTKKPAPMRQHRRTLPASLDELVASCLADDPSERPGLPQLLLALNEHISSGPKMWPAGFVPTA